MFQLLISLLAFLICITVAFALTFTAITIYIASQRRVKPKYHFTGVAEPQPESDLTDEDKIPVGSAVDKASAKMEWDKKAVGK